MSTEDSARQQAKMQEFVKLLPLTIEIAGLPRSEHGEYFNEDQMDLRVQQIRRAYKMARQLVIEMAKPAEG